MATPKVTHWSHFVVGMAMYRPLNVTEICLSTSAASCRSIASFESPWSFLTKRKSLAMAISYKIEVTASCMIALAMEDSCGRV